MKKIKFKQLLYTLKYGLNPKNRPDAYVVAAIIVLTSLYVTLSPTLTLRGIIQQKTNSDIMGMLVDGITIAAVISIWISDLARDWKKQLVKYLSVSFKFEGNTRIKKSHVLLIGDSDIRQMAQSLGQSWNNGIRLPIEPSIQTMKKEILLDESKKINNGEPFHHYDVEIKLNNDVKTPSTKTSTPKFKCQYSENINKLVNQENIK